MINDSYIRNELRQVQDLRSVFKKENVFLLDESGALVGLNLSSLDIVDLTDVAAFKHLRYLDLSDNRIVDPGPLKHLRSLEKLDLAFNLIDDVSFFLHLPKLNFLNITSNRIARLPSSLAKATIPIKWHYIFQQLGVFLEGNPLPRPVIDVILRGQADLRGYLASMDAGSAPLAEFKAIVLGGGRAGKTSLVRRLIGERFRVDEEVTPGVTLREHQSPVGEVKGHFWDFGGQELMYATHSCFLTRRAVYLVVLDGRREEKAEYWLKLILSVSPESPIFIIINKIDENPDYDLNRAELRRKCKNIEGFFPVSCKTGEGLDRLFEKFWQRAAEFELPKFEFGPHWIKAKDVLLAHGEALVRHDWCLSVCFESGVTDPIHQATLLNCLHDAGLILHFSSSGLGAFAVEHPNWLTAAIYLFLNDAAAKAQHGLISWNDIDRILSHVSGPLSYSPEARRFIVDVMKAFEVCFEVDHNHLLIPDLLPRNEPEELPVFNSIKSEIILTFDFLPTSVFHRCLIDLRNDIVGKNLWLTGVVLEEVSSHARAMIRLEQSDARIVIVADGPRRRDYLWFIRKVIRDTVVRSGGLKYTEWIRLPGDAEYLIDYQELIGRKRMGINQFAHGVSGRLFEVNALLGEVEATEGYISRGDLDLSNTETASAQSFCFVAYAGEDRQFVDRLAEKLRLVGVSVWYDVNIRGGVHFAPEIEKRILSCAAVLLIVTPESHQSNFVRTEVALALQKGKPIIPIQLRVVDQWLEIASPQWIQAADDGRMVSDIYKSVVAYL